MPTALIVDDSGPNRYLLRVLLEAQGFAVTECPDGSAALTAAARAVPDLIVTDLLMPELDGYSLLRQVRADERLRDVPVIVYTATYTEPRDERLVRALGADDFLIKPAEPDVLVARVRDVLERRARGEPRPGPTADERDLLNAYNAVLFDKLQQKIRQLERSNAALVDEIGERRRGESALRDSEERFRATFEQAAIGIAEIDLAGRFLCANERLAAIVGRPADSFPGNDFPDIVARDQQTALYDARRDLVDGRIERYAAELRGARPDGRRTWLDLVLTVLRGTDGAPRRLLLVCGDVTSRRVLEEQLRQSQKMEAIGRLAGGVAHDFNNLLTVVSSYAELIATQPGLDRTQAGYASAIIDACERAAALTAQLLSFGRQSLLQPRLVDLNATLRSTVPLIQRLIGEDITIRLDLSRAAVRVRVDTARLDQVLMNLAVNARDAMPDGGTITITTAHVEFERADAELLGLVPGHYVALTMADTGAGMTREVMGRIFDPFFTTKEPGRGTGLGLATVFGIVEQSGGHVQVASQPGRGSTFEIFLPAVREGDIETTPAPALRDTRGNETILIVEDEPGVRDVAMRSLEQQGYRVLAASDADDALRQVDAEGGRVQALFTDVVMPGLNGLRLAERVAARCPGLRTLYTSGYTDDARIRDELRSRQLDFLPKPYTPLALARALRDLLDAPARTSGD